MHIPVLLDPVMKALALRKGHAAVDATVGLGGHAAEILRKIKPTGKLIAIDLDPANLEKARETLAAVGGPFVLKQGNFAGLPALIEEPVYAILADLGVSSPHLDDPERGFSYRKRGPLDMRLDPTRGRTAADLVNTMGEADLAAAFRDLGDEEDALDIANLIIQRRRREPIVATQDLVKIVCDARGFTVERGAGAKLHPAARTFQALRILVNRELENLERLLAVIPSCLKPGGRAAIISFHSGEDRLVKRAFRDGLRSGVYSKVSDDPIMASEEEREINPRSRSAKLRWAVSRKP